MRKALEDVLGQEARHSKATMSHADLCLLGQEVFFAERVELPSLMPPRDGLISFSESMGLLRGGPASSFKAR